MTTAYKCDRCGGFYEWQRGTLEGSVLKASLRSGWYPDKVDLCQKCSEEAKIILGGWWRAIDLPDKKALIVYFEKEENV